MRTQGTGSGAIPSYTILEVGNLSVSGWYYPRSQICDVAGFPISGAYTQIPVYDYITLTVQGADTGDVVDMWVMLE